MKKSSKFKKEIIKVVYEIVFEIKKKRAEKKCFLIFVLMKTGLK